MARPLPVVLCEERLLSLFRQWGIRCCLSCGRQLVCEAMDLSNSLFVGRDYGEGGLWTSSLGVTDTAEGLAKTRMPDQPADVCHDHSLVRTCACLQAFGATEPGCCSQPEYRKCIRTCAKFCHTRLLGLSHQSWPTLDVSLWPLSSCFAHQHALLRLPPCLQKLVGGHRRQTPAQETATWRQKQATGSADTAPLPTQT